MQDCAKLLLMKMKLFRKSSFAQHAQEKGLYRDASD